jgi:3-oxoacyl-[acyl-carrier-protein] synthase III
MRAGALAPGDHVLLYGVGPGLNLAAAVVEVLGLPAGGDRAV